MSPRGLRRKLRRIHTSMFKLAGGECADSVGAPRAIALELINSHTCAGFTLSLEVWGRDSRNTFSSYNILRIWIFNLDMVLSA